MKQFFTLCLIALFAVPVLAQDESDAAKKKAKPSSWQVSKVKKMLKDVELTSEQQDGFKKAAASFGALLSELQKGGLTKEMRAARAKKLKEGRGAGSSGKDLVTHINEGLSEEQIEMFSKLDKGVMSFEMTVAKMITEDQLAELPEKVKKRVMQMAKGEKTRKGGGGKKKKKKKDAASDE